MWLLEQTYINTFISFAQYLNDYDVAGFNIEFDEMLCMLSLFLSSDGKTFIKLMFANFIL